MKKEKNEHYVSNKDFTNSVVEYVTSLKEAQEEGKPAPKIPEYIGECFLKISKGIAKRPNWSQYSYVDEMILDGVEDCVRRIGNFDIRISEKDRKPKAMNYFLKQGITNAKQYNENIVVKKKNAPLNAFGYFSKIIWFAFLRRLLKEEKHENLKERLIDENGIMGLDCDDCNENIAENIVERVRHKREQNLDKEETPIYKDKTIKRTRKKRSSGDSQSLEQFMI